MKTKTKILFAFLLNLCFSIFEFVGGIYTGSVSIMSDSIHDFGDAISIGFSYFMEKISEKKPDNKYTYGYSRYSILGGLVTTIILLVGSILIIANAINRLVNPIAINSNGMLIVAVIGCVINFIAMKLTHGNHSINQKAVNLHMLEDMLGWLIVLIGSIIIKFTDFTIIDPIMSICLSIFIIYNVIRNLKPIFEIFTLKVPNNIDIETLKKEILSIHGVTNINRLNIWQLDENNIIATIDVTVNTNEPIKHKILGIFNTYAIFYVTVEINKSTVDVRDIIITRRKCNCGHHH
jgi:cobalt-zinc-cadmium efflux system protein